MEVLVDLHEEVRTRLDLVPDDDPDLARLVRIERVLREIADAVSCGAERSPA